MSVTDTLATLDVDHLNLHLVNVNKLIEDQSVQLINQLTEFEVKLDLSNRVCKRFLYSDLIHTLCEYVCNSKSKNKVVFYYCRFDMRGDLLYHFKATELQEFYTEALKTTQRVLPLRIYNCKVTLDYVSESMADGDSGMNMLLHAIKSKSDRVKIEKYYFSTAKDFFKRYELKFLSDKYFTNMKTKQIVYK